jgi:GNAT superfamily N-acetyltransferase
MKLPITEARRLLEEDPMRNLVTLKMLTCYPGAMDFELLREEKRWALLSLLEVSASAWDRETYPDCKYAAFINGNDGDKMIQLLARLPKEDLVVKTTDEVVWEWLVQTRNGTKVLAFHSFTSEVKSGAGTPDEKIASSSVHNEAAWKMFRANGYVDEELVQYFRNGAKWFGIKEDGQLASACFVFENYQRVWEIAGVYTQPDYRRRGLARKVVEAALVYLAQAGLVPRYQARWDNHPSLSLARACGLNEFLRMEHYIVRKRE